MRRIYAVLIIIILAELVVLTCETVASATTYRSACSVTEAHARVHKAVKAVHRAEARLAEARRVLTATRAYTSQYGGGVGRWTWLSRGTGWSWVQMPTLMMVVSRESGGRPDALNPSGAAGLLQEMPGWYRGEWWQYTYDPFNPRSNLHYGHLIWHRSGGWAPWNL